MISDKWIIQSQKEICNKVGAEWFEASLTEKIGVSWNVKGETVMPINGLRHMPEAGTNGWYIWAGEEFFDSEEFIVPLHCEHLIDWAPNIIKYLGLPPGWRWLWTPTYEDIWFDANLL